MPYIDVEQLLGQSGTSLFKLVIIASRRALEIADGQPRLVESSPHEKPSVVALKEIMAGKVLFKKG